MATLKFNKFAEDRKAKRKPIQELLTVQNSESEPAAIDNLEKLGMLDVASKHGSVTTFKIVVLEQQVDELKKENLTLKTSTPMLKINPKLIKASKFANRLDESFTLKEFEEFRTEISSTGGNVQPIKVRSVRNDDKSDPGGYEIIFGHRRHRACLDLGLDVAAIVEDVDDRAMFIEMEHENRQRKNLRPFEQGVMYAKALDAGLFPTVRKMAFELGVSPGSLSMSLALARLPPEILNAFSSPLDLQFRWAKDLQDLAEKNMGQVLKRVEQLKVNSRRLRAVDVYRFLIDGDVDVSANSPSTKTISITGQKGQSASIDHNEANNVVVVNLKNIDATKVKNLCKLIEDFISDESVQPLNT
jgi:ParB family chromosome partitioning protein